MRIISRTIDAGSEKWLELRHPNINSSEVSALFGLSPYQTVYGLWAEKTERTERKSIDNVRVRAGTKLERPLAEFVIEETWGNFPGEEGPPPPVEDFNEYIYEPDLRIGANFDFIILGQDIVEAKNVDSFVYSKDWIKGEGPPHIELQIQHQMLMMECLLKQTGQWKGPLRTHLCVLVGGNQPVRIIRKQNDGIKQKIIERVAYFWHQSADPRWRPRKDMAKDYTVVSEMYKRAAVRGKVGLASAEHTKLGLEYKELGDTVREAKKRQEIIKAEIKQTAEGAVELINEDVCIKLLPRFSVKKGGE